MNLKSIPLLLIVPTLMLMLAACGGDTQALPNIETYVAAKVFYQAERPSHLPPLGASGRWLCEEGLVQQSGAA